MKVIIMRHEAAVPGNYSWSCVGYPGMSDKEVPIWEMMGHVVVDLPEDEAKALCKRGADALKLQFQLAEMFNREKAQKS